MNIKIIKKLYIRNKMSNFYNNNNRGIYGNPNNIYGQQGQNIYSNNNYNRPQGNYNNNYNPGNYNQNQNNNYNNYQQQNYNQNQQNSQIKPFISGYMGRILISSETLDQFSKSLKSAEWTNNPNYLQARNIQVKMKLSTQGQNRSDINIPRNRFNEYGINSNFNINEFTSFFNNANESIKRQKEQNENEKINFIRNNFPSEKCDLNMNNLYVKIGQSRKDVLMKDSSLFQKVERLLPRIKPFEAPKNLEYEKKESKNSEKIFTNNGSGGTPGLN